MANCLITKLPVSVEDESLSKLGIMTVLANSVNSANYQNSAIGFYNPCKYKCYHQDGTTEELTSGYAATVTIPSDCVKLEVTANESGVYGKTKYPITREVYIGTRFRINAKELSGMSLTELVSNVLFGKIEDLAKVNTFVRLNTYLVEGDVSKLGVMMALTVLSIGAGLTGSIESLVAAYRANGKVTNAEGITIPWTTNHVTFGGATKTFSDASQKLTWTENAITLAGETIEG